MTNIKQCSVCKGIGTVPTICPRCFGSGKLEPEYMIIFMNFKDGKQLVVVVMDGFRRGIFLLNPYETLHLPNIYIGKYISRTLKCSSAWYMSRWDKRK